MQAYSHHFESTNEMDSQLDPILPLSPDRGIEGAEIVLHTSSAPLSYGSRTGASFVASIGVASPIGTSAINFAASQGNDFAPVYAGDYDQANAACPWSFILHSPDITTTSWFADDGFAVSDAILDHELIDHQYGFGDEQLYSAPVDNSTMVSSGPMNGNFGDMIYQAPMNPGFNGIVSLAPTNSNYAIETAYFDMDYMPYDMSNPLYDFSLPEQIMVPDIQPSFDQSFNPVPAAAPIPAAPNLLLFATNNNPNECRVCSKFFKRVSDRKRHEDSVHLSVPGTFLCHIQGCPKNHGKGWKRADKVTQHLWEKHASLGYTRAA